jgi:hypothetical protein
MKVIVSLLVFIFSNIFLFSQPHDHFQGLGTEENSYQIWTKNDLEVLGDSVNSDWFYSPNPPNPPYYNWLYDKHFRLMTDISGVTKSIGWKAFNGHFHGNNKTITVDINPPYSYPYYSVGTLFSGLANGGTIDSLTVNGYINDGYAGIVGGVAANCKISHCINNVNNISMGGIAGGITSATGIISDCINNGSVNGVAIVYDYTGTVQLVAGGIVGENQGQIINCINNGKIKAPNAETTYFSGIGGIVGACPNGLDNISNCINLGTVTLEGQGNVAVGGIVGLVRTVNPLAQNLITNCINYGFVKGVSSVGGIVGIIHNNLYTITNCTNIGVVSGSSNVGCIVGNPNGNPTTNIRNCHYDEQMCGE